MQLRGHLTVDCDFWRILDLPVNAKSLAHCQAIYRLRGKSAIGRKLTLSIFRTLNQHQELADAAESLGAGTVEWSMKAPIVPKSIEHEFSPDDPLMVTQAAQRFNFPAHTFYALCADGSLRHSKICAGRGTPYCDRVSRPDYAMRPSGLILALAKRRQQ